MHMWDNRRIVSILVVVLMLVGGIHVAVGDGSTFSGSDLSSIEPVGPDELVPAFYDDMENGTNGWNSTGFWHIVHNDSFSPPWNISYSGKCSWWYGQDSTGDYDNTIRNFGNLTSPTVGVDTYPVFLRFMGYYDTETARNGSDIRKVMISVDGGEYTEVDTLQGDIPDAWNSYLYNITPYIPVKYNYTLPWTKEGTVMGATLSGESGGLLGNSVILENGTYKMWYTAKDSSSIFRIYYATSQDGYSWTKHGLIMDVDNQSIKVYYPVVIHDGNLYKMWYSGYNGSAARIFYATSPDGINWTKQGLVLGVGPSSYDINGVWAPFVLKENGVYRMWYTSKNSDGFQNICYATSTDGFTWTKIGVLMSGDAAYENLGVSHPYIVKFPDGIYRMWYTAYNDDGISNHYRIKSAYSDDGINWTKGNVEINYGSSTEPDGVAFPSALLDGNELKMWYTGVDWSGPEVINLAVSPITTYLGGTHDISVRFSFDTVDSLNNSYQGWYIDDFSIDERIPPSVLETSPADGDSDVFPSNSVMVVFNHSMDTSHIPVLSQTAGDAVSYTFDGWQSTYRENDTAVWSHGNWSEGDSVSLEVSNYIDGGGDSGEAYSWSFSVGILHSADVSPATDEKYALPGNTVEYNVTITNTGLLDDTYDLILQNGTWNSGIYDLSGVEISQVSIGVGNSTNVLVRVDIPSNTNDYDEDTVDLLVLSQNSSSATAVSTLTTRVPFTAPWFDDVEGSPIGWSPTYSWERGIPSSGPSSSFSGAYCWGTNLDGNYGNYAQYTLDTPVVYLPSGGAMLYFETWYSIESHYDAGKVQIKEVGSSSWTTISPVEGPLYSSTYTFGSGYSGSTGGWVQAGFDLDAYSGKMVQIRFLLRSDDIITYSGWYIDNIYIGVPDPPSVYGVELDGSASVSAEVGDLLNLTATIDDTLHYNMDIKGAEYLTNRSSARYSMNALDGSFDSPVEDVCSTINTTGWAVGDYEIYVEGWNAIPLRNKTHTSYALLHLTDTRAPEISSLWPPDGGYSDNVTPLIYAHIEDYSSIDTTSIRLYINGFSVAFTSTAITNGYNISYQQETELSPGDVITCRIVASDIYGNELDRSWSFTINGPVDVSVHTGWNLMSLPWLETPTDINTALSGFSWDRAMVYLNGTWYTYNKNRDARYNLDFPYVDSTMGIWINCTAAATVNGTNSNPGTKNIHLNAGWNLVGFPSSHDVLVSDALSGLPWTHVEGADASGNTYALLASDYLRVGRAYWIYVETDCVWSIPW